MVGVDAYCIIFFFFFFLVFLETNDVSLCWLQRPMLVSNNDNRIQRHIFIAYTCNIVPTKDLNKFNAGTTLLDIEDNKG